VSWGRARGRRGDCGGLGSVLCEDTEDIWSTIWPGSGLDCSRTRGYDTLAGTSMAAPFVSGVVALLAGKGLSNAQIVDRLKTRSSHKGYYNPVGGYGIVDADAATR
jgi:subtilisin family serine protease